MGVMGVMGVGGWGEGGRVRILYRSAKMYI